jgi:hypothetical protein
MDTPPPVTKALSKGCVPFTLKEKFLQKSAKALIHNLPPWFDLFYASVFIKKYECIDFVQ